MTDKEIFEDLFFEELEARLDAFRATRVAPSSRAGDRVLVWFTRSLPMTG